MARSLKKRSLTNLKKLLKETERKTESLLKMVQKLEGVKVVRRKAPKSSKRRKSAPKRRTAKRAAKRTTKRTAKRATKSVYLRQQGRGWFAKVASRDSKGRLKAAHPEYHKAVKAAKKAVKKESKGHRVVKGGKGRKASKKGGSPSTAVRQEKKIVQATRQLEKAAKRVEKAVKAPKSKKAKETGKSLLSGLLKQTPHREVFIPEDDFAEIVERGGGLTDE